MRRLLKSIAAMGVAVAVSALVTTAGFAGGGELKFSAELSREQEVPAPGPGNITEAQVEAEFDDALTEVSVKLRVEGGTNVKAAHFHCARAGVAGPVVFGLFSPGPLVFDGERAEGTLTNANFSGVDCVPHIGRPVSNIAALALAMRDGLIYANVHTTDNPSGEVRGQMLED